MVKDGQGEQWTQIADVEWVVTCIEYACNTYGVWNWVSIERIMCTDEVWMYRVLTDLPFTISFIWLKGKIDHEAKCAAVDSHLSVYCLDYSR